MKKEIQLKITNSLKEIKNLHASGDIAKALEVAKEVEKLEKELELLNFTDSRAGEIGKKAIEPTQPKPQKIDIYNLIRKPGALKNATLTGGGDNGILLPSEDVKEVRSLSRAFGSLEDLITVTNTKNRSGSFISETLSNEVGLIDIEEGAEFGDLNDLKFNKVAWNCKDKGGIIRVSNSMLKDTAENLRAYILKALARKSAITIRSAILKALATGATVVEGSDIDAIKTAINVDLDSSLLEDSKILMSSETFDYLDNLKDSQGRYLLQPVPGEATRKSFNGLAIEKLGKMGTTDSELIPFGRIYVGNFKEFANLFQMDGVEIAESEHAFFASNVTAFRALLRFDVAVADPEAVVSIQLETE